ncbi:MAG: DegT/DnrJ/EryC1/StrS family aminotransferase [Candidatus Paceibacterota bacterium]
MKIPLYKPYIDRKTQSAVLRVLTSGKLSRGPEVERFEKEFAKYTNKKYAVAVNSGTSGLHMLVRAMGWKSGDEVITTPFSYIASSNALLFEGVRPIFVDIDIKTLNIDPQKIEEKINKNTKGMLLVDILGLPVDHKAIKKICDKYRLRVIEDACEAIGRPSEDFTVNKLGDATVYGFHENKQLTTAGEGGMIVTDNIEIAKRCWAMRDQGRSLKKDWINSVTLGFNFRMTEVQSAFGREQLRVMDKVLEKRRLLAQIYTALFNNVKGVVLPIQKSFNSRSWFLYFIVLESSVIRDRVYKTLLANDISSSKNYFPPIYDFPMYHGFKKNCPNTEAISQTLLALPMFYEMNITQVKKVVDVVRRTLM